MLPDWGRCFHESVPERPRAAALVAGFGGSLSSAAVGAGALVNRCSESSRAEASSCCGEGLMVGVGVLMAWSCTCWEERAEERCSDCGAVFSGEIDLARSCHGISKVNWKSGTTSRVAPRTCTAR